MKRHVHAVLFDLDNTLADRDGAFSAWAEWFARERLHLADAATIDRVVAELTVLDSGGRASKEILFQTLKERHPHLDQPVESLVHEFRERLVTHLPPLDPEAARLLDALDGANLPWGIVSNGSPSQLHKVGALGLDTRARCVVISEIVGMRKPAPEIFRYAAEAVGAHPRDVLFVGDHPEADVLGAMGAGMWTTWLRRGQEWPAALTGREPHHAIDTLEELLWITRRPLADQPCVHVIEKSAP